MRKLLYLTVLLTQFGLAALSQIPDVIRTPVTPPTGVSRNNRAVSDANLYVPYSLRIPRASSFTLNGAKDSIGYIMFNTTSNKFGVYRGSGIWDTYTSAADITIPGGPISSLPVVGHDPGSNITVKDFIVNEFYQTQAPTASLSGGTTYELGVSDATHNLSFSYGRQMATASISTAVITPGPLNVFSTQPAQPGTVSGSQSVTTPVNTNRTYTLTVTTSDSKTATATTTDTWLPGRYWGRSASATPNSTIIVDAIGGNKELSSSVAGTFTITASGSNYPFFAYPLSEAALTSIKDVNGFEVISAFNVTTVSVTNVNGFVRDYRCYTLNSTTASNYQITTL